MFFFMDNEGNDDDRQSLIDLFQFDTGDRVNQEEAVGGMVTEAVKEEESEDKNVYTSSISEGDKKLELRRQKGKIRSKQSRDRKKKYLEELESRVKDLEKENMRLQFTLDQYK